MVREPAMEGMLGEEIYELSPEKFQEHCFSTCERLVDVAIEVAGRTGGESNRPPYRTKEVTSMVKEARVLEAAKREAYILKKVGGEFCILISLLFTNGEKKPLPRDPF